MFRIGLPCIVLSCVALNLIITIIALTIPYWECLSKPDESTIYRSSESEERGIYVGLWQVCYYQTTGQPDYRSSIRSSRPTVFLCSPINFIYGYFQATRALVILGMAMIATTLVCGIIKQYVLQKNQALLKVGAGCGFAAGVFLLIGISVFSANFNADKGTTWFNEELREISYHAGFGLCIIAAILSIVTGAVFFVWNRKDHAETANSVA